MPALKAIARRAPVILQVTNVLNSACVDQNVFVADRDYYVEEVHESHATAGTDAGSVTLDVKIASGTTAIAAGTSVLASTFNCKSTANTVVSKTVKNGGVTAGKILEAGSRIGLDFTGTVTALAGQTVTIVLNPVSGS